MIWLIDAILKWLPGFKDSYMSTIMGIAKGQPGWLRRWFDFWIRLQHPAATFFCALVATAETLIALALILGVARKLTYVGSIAFSLLIWATAEVFGGPYTSGASDIGTAIIYAVVFAGLLALSYYAGPARYSLDHLDHRSSAGCMYEVAEPQGDRRQDLTGVHPAAESARAWASAVPRWMRARRKLDDLVERVNQGHC